MTARQVPYFVRIPDGDMEARPRRLLDADARMRRRPDRARQSGLHGRRLSSSPSSRHYSAGPPPIHCSVIVIVVDINSVWVRVLP